jgi:hypothetical protein
VQTSALSENINNTSLGEEKRNGARRC